MPDDYHPLMPRRDPERVDLGRMQADIEFLIQRIERLREEQALKPVYTMVGSAAIVIAWIELFWRHCF
jgi:hypothetical protein